jgi:glutamate formiminotransferase/glutamate formiminotransferase/formiminotetrahydrofolate cyclodeaminase
MTPPILLAVPNVSEGRNQETIAAIAAGFAAAGGEGVRLLDVHSDPDHHRSVFTLAGPADRLVDALMAGARVAVERIDVMVGSRDGAPAGQHPHVGALDVAPIVYLDQRARGSACAQALVLGDRIAQELEIPVYMYGELSGAKPREQRARAQLRRGGVAGLGARIAAGEQRMAPDFGPARLHPSAGATLVAARAPLVAFNLQLAPGASLDEARAIAALIRDGGQAGLPGVRAIGVALGGGVAQVSINVEQPSETPLALIVDAVRAHAQLASAELVGLAPAGAFEGFPGDLPIPGFDPARHLIENALRC